jgi:shikimate kinase
VPFAALCVAAAFAGIVSCAFAADPPEATDPDVRRCAVTAQQRLARNGFDHAKVVHADARRRDACILRWEDRFSAGNPTKVATLIVVPVDVELKTATATHATTVNAHCGYTDGKLQAFEIVAGDKPC